MEDGIHFPYRKGTTDIRTACFIFNLQIRNTNTADAKMFNRRPKPILMYH